MDLEVRGLPNSQKSKCGSRLKSYKEEYNSLEQNFVSVVNSNLLSTAFSSYFSQLKVWVHYDFCICFV